MARFRRHHHAPDNYLDQTIQSVVKNLWTIVLIALLGMFIYQVKVGYPAMDKDLMSTQSSSRQMPSMQHR
jgi:hypothetical protein